MTQREQRPRIAVTLGDPGGIGPEVIMKALAEAPVRQAADWRILGPASAWREPRHGAPGVTFIERSPFTGWMYGGARTDWPHAPSIDGGETSFQVVCDAVELGKLPASDPRRVDAIVTGPISKEAWALAGHQAFPGHTELLADRFGVRESDFGMFFHAPAADGRVLNVMLATVHVPLSKVPGLLTVGRIVSAIKLGTQACAALGTLSPRVAVCGVNPHAGEHGVLGHEDDAVIAPAIEAARELGIDATGPFPGDTVFQAALKGKHDLVVAMYHDQGLIPVKLLAFDRAVNVTVGLPIPRTSPDHGTAFDIAGKGIADAGSMTAAMNLAVKLATAKD